MTTAVGQRILNWLDREDRTQSQLSRMAGPPLSDGYLSRIIKGKQPGSTRALGKLDGVMGLELGTLRGLQTQEKGGQDEG